MLGRRLMTILKHAFVMMISGIRLFLLPENRPNRVAWFAPQADSVYRTHPRCDSRLELRINRRAFTPIFKQTPLWSSPLLELLDRASGISLDIDNSCRITVCG